MTTSTPGKRSRSFGWLWVALMLVLLSCTSHQQYRRIRPYSTSPAPNARIAIVEFDDSGELWSYEQLDYALGAVGLAAADRAAPGAIVVTYVHGWNNNASHANGADPGGNMTASSNPAGLR
jgi:hypothetical protein